MNNNEKKGKGRIAALKGLFAGKGLRRGYSQPRVPRYVGPGQGHLILIAPTRVSVRAPVLLRCLLDMPADNAEMKGRCIDL